MIPEKGTVQYLHDCRCCRARHKGTVPILTTYQAAFLDIVGQFDKGVRLAACDRCHNISVHDLIAISRDAELEEKQG